MDGWGKLQALYRDVVPVSQSSQRGVGGGGVSSIFQVGEEVEEERMGFKKLQRLRLVGQSLALMRCLELQVI